MKSHTICISYCTIVLYINVLLSCKNQARSVIAIVVKKDAVLQSMEIEMKSKKVTIVFGRSRNSAVVIAGNYIIFSPIPIFFFFNLAFDR